MLIGILQKVFKKDHGILWRIQHINLGIVDGDNLNNKAEVMDGEVIKAGETKIVTMVGEIRSHLSSKEDLECSNNKEEETMDGACLLDKIWETMAGDNSLLLKIMVGDNSLRVITVAGNSLVKIMAGANNLMVKIMDGVNLHLVKIMDGVSNLLLLQMGIMVGDKNLLKIIMVGAQDGDKNR